MCHYAETKHQTQCGTLISMGVISNQLDLLYMEASQNSKDKIQFNRGRPHIKIPKSPEPKIDLSQLENKDHEVIKDTRDAKVKNEAKKNTSSLKAGEL